MHVGSAGGVMLVLRTELADPMAALRLAGVDARLAWHGDSDCRALVLIEPNRTNLMRLERWLERNPRASSK